MPGSTTTESLVPQQDSATTRQCHNQILPVVEDVLVEVDGIVVDVDKLVSVVDGVLVVEVVELVVLVDVGLSVQMQFVASSQY